MFTEFSREVYWSGWVAFPSPGDLPDPGIKSGSPALQAGSLLIELSGKIQSNIFSKLLNHIKIEKVALHFFLSVYWDRSTK